ncbi:MAG: GNAT family N-acetyltransferase [Ruminococcus sp.]|nr:GNAT family N-acetyltransferase [Ruminococcus sp.]
MDITFGPLTENDLPAAFELCMRTFSMDTPAEEVRKVYSRFKDDPYYHFIVGKVDGKVAAYTTMVIYYNLFDGDYPVAALWYVCVDEQYRRCGIGTKMFRYIEALAKEHGCELISFTAESRNTGAHEFYRLAGYSDTKETAFVKYFFEEE